MAIISVPLRSIALLSWQRRRCTSTHSCHRLALNLELSWFTTVSTMPPSVDELVAGFRVAVRDGDRRIFGDKAELALILSQ
jgi:hypothetical protein